MKTIFLIGGPFAGQRRVVQEPIAGTVAVPKPLPWPPVDTTALERAGVVDAHMVRYKGHLFRLGDGDEAELWAPLDWSEADILRELVRVYMGGALHRGQRSKT